MYFLDGSHELTLALPVFLHLDHFIENLVKILLILFLLQIVNNFLQGVEVIILEDIHLEILEFLGAEGTPMVSVHRLLDTFFAVYMTTTRYVAIFYGVQAYCALEFMFKQFCWDAEVVLDLGLFYYHCIKSLIFLKSIIITIRAKMSTISPTRPPHSSRRISASKY